MSRRRVAKAYAPPLLRGVLAFFKAKRGKLLFELSEEEAKQLLIDAGLDEYSDEAFMLEVLGDALGKDEDDAFSVIKQDALKTWTLELNHVSNSAAKSLSQLIRSASKTPRTLAQLEVEVQGITGLLRGQARTIANTAIAQAQRQVQLQQAENIPPHELVFVYQGPENDSVLRPFCKACVGKAFTKTQINRLNNGQGLSVMKNGGGWNCRHTWQPMPRSAAITAGFEIASDTDVQRANTAARR